MFRLEVRAVPIFLHIDTVYCKLYRSLVFSKIINRTPAPSFGVLVRHVQLPLRVEAYEMTQILGID